MRLAVPVVLLQNILLSGLPSGNVKAKDIHTQPAKGVSDDLFPIIYVHEISTLAQSTASDDIHGIIYPTRR